ncbi:MAG: ABC transporter ATP-binding protein, partial [Chloroflexota bacterium]|nr:ABC transporter ATP-binding protein [Chloroflexota bacterium]
NGAGKSSLLLALATLLPANGVLRFHDVPITDPQAFRRRVSVVFQRPLLLDRSVRDNAAVGLALRGVSRAERHARAATELRRLGIAHLADRPANGLSGGEAQRVSIARALAVEPELLFLDEPFSALDAPARELLIADLTGVLRGRGVTTVMVTHDRDEALSLADRIAVVMNGVVRQCDSAETVFAMPTDPEVAAFVGVENVLPAKVTGSTDELTALRISDQLVEVTALAPAGDDFPLLCIRPDDVVISRTSSPSSARNSFAARIVRIEPIGRRTRLVLDCGFPLIAHVTRQSAREMELTDGDRVVASFKATAPHLLPRHRAAGRTSSMSTTG